MKPFSLSPTPEKMRGVNRLDQPATGFVRQAQLRSGGDFVSVSGVVCARDAHEGPGKAVEAAATPSL